MNELQSTFLILSAYFSSTSCRFYSGITLIIIHSTQYIFSDWPNFRNQRLGRHLAADYTIIMSRTLKVTGNHVMYDRGAWFLRVIMSSSRALCCLPSVKKQKHDFQVCFVDRARHRKSSEDKESQTQKGQRRWQRSCLLITWKRKNRENPRKRKSWHKLWKHFLSERERKDSFNVYVWFCFCDI